MAGYNILSVPGHPCCWLLNECWHAPWCRGDRATKHQWLVAEQACCMCFKHGLKIFLDYSSYELQLLWTKYPQQRSSLENTEAPFIYCHNEVHALQACLPLGSSLAQCGLVMDKKWGNSWKANVLGYPRCQLHMQSRPYISLSNCSKASLFIHVILTYPFLTISVTRVNVLTSMIKS